MKKVEPSSNSKCAIIIVTHNSQIHLKRCLECLQKQTWLPAQIILIDSGSDNLDDLKLYAKNPNTCFYASRDNVGFCKGNNIGLSLVAEDIEYVLFLNPDAFLPPHFIEQACQYMDQPEQEKTAIISGLLLGYDINQDHPTGQIDSAGIFRKWYGNWYDRKQGAKYHQEHFSKEEIVPALCGALLFCRKTALKSVLLGPNEVWDNSFFMYKEDIDLCLRLRKKGWELKFLPSLIAYHCRGWNKDRTQIPKQLRLLSARNEIKLFARAHSPCLLYSSIKYLSVKLFNV